MLLTSHAACTKRYVYARMKMNNKVDTIKFSCFCPTCNSIVEHERVFDYQYNIDRKDDVSISGTSVVLGKCLNCNEPILQRDKFNHVDDHYWSDGFDQLYPIIEIEASKNAPKIVRGPYSEAIKCYRVQAYDACVIMCRKGIEAICIDKKLSNGNLFDKLKKLKDIGILSTEMYQWSDELRLLGNDCAHDHNEIVTKEDAKDSIDFFEALITYLYQLTIKYNNLKERRKGTKELK
jgi:hypothetical protein